MQMFEICGANAGPIPTQRARQAHQQSPEMVVVLSPSCVTKIAAKF
jgi:hypothetical protein